jgi:hypothetical protein
MGLWFFFTKKKKKTQAQRGQLADPIWSPQPITANPTKWGWRAGPSGLTWNQLRIYPDPTKNSKGYPNLFMPESCAKPLEIWFVLPFIYFLYILAQIHSSAPSNERLTPNFSTTSEKKKKKHRITFKSTKN